MNKSINKKKPSAAKTLKIILIILLTPVALVILFIIYTIVSNPIYDKLDNDRFNMLDTSMQSVYQRIKSVSDGAERWKYITTCETRLQGDWPTGNYDCVTSISTTKMVQSVAELNILQSRYFHVIDKNSNLKQIDQLNVESPNDFGKKFVVSSAEKKYKETNSGIECKYSIMLFQSVTDGSSRSDMLGTQIISGKARVIVSLRCDEIAREPWYGTALTTSMLIPE